MVRVCCSSVAVAGVLVEKISSGCDPTSSFANRCIASMSAAALRPPELLESLPERRDDRLSFRAALGKVPHQHPDAPHALVLLRPRSERPGDRHTADERDELPSPHGLALIAGDY